MIDELVTQTDNYVTSMQAMIAHIKNAKNPEDRLGYASELTFCFNSMLVSIKGWSAWINNIQTLCTLDIEELKEVYNNVKEIAVAFLTIDLKITEKKLKETKAKVEKIQNTENIKKEKTYVS